MSEILGAFFGLLLGLMFMPRVLSGVATEHQTQMEINTARQQQEWVDAVSSYVSGNMTALEGSAGPTTPVTISLATVQAAGIQLATGFSGTNPYNQTWTAQVKQPSAGNLQVLIYSTGGSVITDQQLGAIASVAGGVGGFIPSNNSGVYASGPAMAYGAYGSWTVSTTNYANIAGGHPASFLNFSNGTLTSNYLYRNAVPGQPQLNQMNTALGMNGNNIRNVGQVQTAAGNGVQIGSSYFYGDTANTAIRQNGTLYIQNQAGTASAGINVGNVTSGNISTNGNVSATGTISAGGNLSTNGSFTAGGTATIGSNLQVNGSAQVNGNQQVYGSSTTQGQLITNAYLQVSGLANIGWGCAPDGMLARASDGSGFVQCLGGIWQHMGGYSKFALVIGNASNYTSTATCPSGWQLITGGYDWWGNNPPSGVTVSAPTGSNTYAASFGVAVGGANIRAQILCAQ